MKIRRNPDCPVCGNEPTQTELIDYDVFCGVASDQFEDQAKTSEKFIEIKPSELRDRLKVDPPPFLLDVREPFEWDIVNLSDLGAFLIPLGELSERIAELPSDREIVVHCRSGVRSAKAADILSDSGFSGLYNLNGGILGWIDEVDPCLPKY